MIDMIYENGVGYIKTDHCLVAKIVTISSLLYVTKMDSLNFWLMQFNRTILGLIFLDNDN